MLAKIQAELDRINPDRSVPFDVSHISQLDYTLNAIKEAMRMWPAIASGTYTAPYLSRIFLTKYLTYTYTHTLSGSIRKCSQTYHHNGFTIPKGFSVMTSNYSIMRSGLSDPDEYRPERWEKGSTDYNRYTTVHYCIHYFVRMVLYYTFCYTVIRCRLQEVFIPFSLGRRNCIGMNLAMLETKLAAATILRSFTFERVNKGDIRIADVITMFPLNEGVYVKERA